MVAVPHPRGADGETLLSIGQVLNRLSVDFAELSPSKLRFLEEQGLVTPARTKSGYRKFSQADIERLRLVLTLQRDHYLPLRVISEHLAALDAGQSPEVPGTAAAAQAVPASILGPKTVLDRGELLRLTGVSALFLNEIISAKLLPAAEVFPRQSIELVTSLRSLADRGITPNHLRSLRLAAERDAELIERSVSARGSEVPAHRAEQSLQLADELDRVRASVLRTRLLG
ncbi:transcriptional regulator FtsR [Leucobacter sp. M11]|uniref:transcriptional regulator FtsR n=1 Tax=Leucobacter sp. M11 TaxID=2993565 RepID=UPI002D7FEC50|nr:MerR family transcriptional regulator [Leucobacter sp. M11]MEB4616547.1 MerR family transcriptional regulator [Leucobacter sp. M11]